LCFIVVSRVVNIDDKPIDSVVGRRKIFASRHSLHNSDHNMDQSDRIIPDTQFKQSCTSHRTESWNKVVSTNESYQNGPSTQTTYRSSFPWPKKGQEVAPDIEPIIVDEKVVPGTAVPIHETYTEKSYTIPNLSEMVEKADVSFATETESYYSVDEKINKKTE